VTPLLDAIQAATSHRHAALLCLLAGHGATFDGAAVEHDGRRLVVVLREGVPGAYVLPLDLCLDRAVIDVLTAIHERGEPALRRPPITHLPSCPWPARLCGCGAEQHVRYLINLAKGSR
jgi:hypothetical protein